MNSIRSILLYLISIVSFGIILLSILSLFHDLSFWYIRILDFPRLQYLISGLLCLLLLVLLNRRWKLWSALLGLGLLFAIGVQGSKILPYFFGDKPVPDAVEATSEANRIGILIANVLMCNTRSQEFLEITEAADPDLILVMEVDQKWIARLQPLKKEYPFVMEYPLGNAYGMALYSRLPLRDQKIMFLNQKTVPSFHAGVQLPSDRIIRFHGVHPVAPVPKKEYPDNMGEEEIALLKVGKMVAEDSLPSIIAGDLNDVSWSHTSRLFEEKGDLKNVRLGRGLYNSFNAKSRIMRWPLDHFFVTGEFRLEELERLPEFNSDHFPMFAELILEE